MQVSNSYWAPDLKFQERKTKPFLDKTLGFTMDIPWPLPTSVGFYSGEGAIPGRRELSFQREHQAESFATDNIIPSSGGIPLINMYLPHYKFKRSDVTFKV